MKTQSILTFLLTLAVVFTTSAIAETTVRFSEVCAADTPKSTSMKSVSHDETLQVKDAALITEKDIQSSFPFSDSQGWGVSITLTPESSKRFDDALQNLYGKRLAIIVDDKLVSAPTLMLKRANGKLQITGNFSESEARKISSDLNKNTVEQGAAANP